MKVKRIDHVAIICSDYEKSKKFYVDILGLKIVSETYRAERKSYMLKLALGDIYQIELFSFPECPPRVSNPDACGLRHLALEVNNFNQALAELSLAGVVIEELRFEQARQKKFVFIRDPDGLPIELFEESELISV